MQFVLLNPANVVTLNPSIGIRDLQTNFVVDIDKDRVTGTADIRIRDNASAGD